MIGVEIMLTTEQKLLSIVAHLGWLLGFPVLAPLIILLLVKDDFIKDQAKEALSFQIGIVIAGLVFGILSMLLIGLPFLIIVALGGLIFPFVATIKVINEEPYTYPITGKYIARKL